MRNVERASDLVEKALVQSILEQKLLPHTTLKPERELASIYKVGRPAVREAIQRMVRDGWLSLRKGMPPAVNDVWQQGNLMTIASLLNSYENIPREWISYMLELRISLTPSYIRDAVETNRAKAAALLLQANDLKPDAADFARFDWELQRGMAALSSNPLYLLIINSFTDFYITMAVQYFEEQSHRMASRTYYAGLLEAVLAGRSKEAEAITRKMMQDSLKLWRNKNEELNT
ncbi:GntR family transcriptional regulator [Bacillus sp. FJAT-42376]|uniref:GntR family transcriptional regulator n=1 Tax=Bacillus sp. FJAT-42376 TaxID=2014076 RepID=UPI000F4EAD4C|nr:GntR family transcriptional regulator [Bacillus sp. FJAT-42376]AZB44383.1 GntR family transcriptional regulator [Bacillus sp. FJAT-42376]